LFETFFSVMEFEKELSQTIKSLCAPGKGFLAADESTSTIKQRFDKIGVENIEENRRQYRQLLFENSKESSKYISGVIFYDETIKQKDDNGVLFTKVLHDNGIVSGIKVDLGQLHIPFTKELRTIGLDDLDKRCKNYYSLGARFAKWRGQIDIDAKNNIPSKLAIEEQCSHLARYASICQLNGLVPIVEPEVMVLEGDHDIHTSYEITERVLHKTFKELKKT